MWTPSNLKPILDWLAIPSVFLFLALIVRFRKPLAVTDDAADDHAELDAYLNANLSGADIGRRYERYIGYLFEVEGYEVEYHGALKGFEDLGRDLIVKGGNEILLIQAKCWAKHKQIPEKYVYQLHGSAEHYKREKNKANVRAVLYTTASYSAAAIKAAQALGVDLEHERLDRTYPVIKCIVGDGAGEGTYYLPTDSGYDAVKVETRRGDLFVQTVAIASAREFKRCPKARAAG